MPFHLRIPRPLYVEMLHQAQTELPYECCGLLAGRVEAGVGRTTHRYPLLNSAASPIEYLADPKSQFQAHRDMRLHGTEILAIYHSHPTHPPLPSGVDLARNFWPETMCLIISMMHSEPEMRGWWLGETDFRPGEWVVVDDDKPRA